MELNEGIEIAKSLGLPIYGHEFGTGSYAQLDGVTPNLVTVAELAIKLCEYDGTVLLSGGLRTQMSANANAAKDPPVGIINSRHIQKADGWGHAIDVIPLVPGRGIVWDDLTSHRAMAKAVKISSAILSVPIRQGCDWNMNGTWGESREWDWDHFEDPMAKYQEAAHAEMMRYRRELGLDKIEDIPDRIDDSDVDRPTFTLCKCPHCDKSIKLCMA